MIYHADDVIEVELARLRSRRQRHAERMSINQEVLPAIKMIVGEWYVDELGVRTREITARESVGDLEITSLVTVGAHDAAWRSTAMQLPRKCRCLTDFGSCV
jgi:hypothetical protein